MAVTFGQSLNSTGQINTANQSSYNFTVTAPTSGRACLLGIVGVRAVNSPGFVSSVSGLGLTWTMLVRDAADLGNGHNVEIWEGVGTPSGATTLTVAWGVSIALAAVSLTEWDGADDSGSGAMKVTGQSDTANGGGTNGTAVSGLSLPSAPSSICFGVVSHESVQATTPDGWTEVADVGGEAAQLCAAYASADQDWAPSWATSADWMAVMIEIAPAAGGGITGDAAWTEAADTSSASGTFTTTGTSAWTEAADTAAASGTFTTTGTSAWTEAADTCVASGWILVTGTAAWTEAADTCDASGVSAEFVGTATWTEAADTLAASGSFTTTGTAAWTEDADTCDASGTFTPLAITGTAAWTEAADTCAASGVVAEFVGEAAWTEAADTLAGTGTFSTTGTSAWTESADTIAATGTFATTGTAAWTEAADTIAASGTFVITGTAAWTEAADTCSAAGTFTMTGTASWTEAADTCAATGVFALPVFGTATWTEAADTLAAIGSVGTGTIVGVGTLWSVAVLSGLRESQATLTGLRGSRAVLSGKRTSEGA